VAERDVVLMRSRPIPYLRLLVLAMLLFAVGIFILVTPSRRVTDGSLGIGVLCVVGAATQALLGIWLVVRARRHAWAVRTGPYGVTCRTDPFTCRGPT
jgi:protein-S-isoprenylcysteine O-methyltransferase Ste14